jgi:hypothetical protein
MTLRQRPLSLPGAAALLAALLALVSCGPGTGGTGTGREPTGYYLGLAGASAGAVCAEAWAASQLGCVPPPPLSPNSFGHPGSTRVAFASVGQVTAANFMVVFEGNTVHLQGGCPRQSFNGDWGLSGDAGGSGAFYGAHESKRTPAPEPARLLVRATADGQNLQLELRALSGSLLLGPLLLQRSPGLGVPPAC